MYKLLNASEEPSEERPEVKSRSTKYQQPDKSGSTSLTSLKELPPLSFKKEVSQEIVKDMTDHYMNDLMQTKSPIDPIDPDSDIIETFDVISNDSEEDNINNILYKEEISLDNHSKEKNGENKNVQADSVQISEKNLEDAKDIKPTEIPFKDILKPSDELTSLKALPPLKLSPLKKDLLPRLDSFKKPEMSRADKEVLEDQLDKDPELVETFNRLQNDSSGVIGVDPLDITEDFSFEEENNPTEDASEIHTTDRSVSPRFISSVSGHDFVEACRPNNFL